jgi:hypothetical protein
MGTGFTCFDDLNLLIPITGNRNWCRWLFPYGETYGILNKVGFYKWIKEERSSLTDNGMWLIRIREIRDIGFVMLQSLNIFYNGTAEL